MFSKSISFRNKINCRIHSSTLTKIQTFATALPNSTSLINFSFNTRDDLFDSAKVRMYNSPKVIFRLLLQLAMFDSRKY